MNKFINLLPYILVISTMAVGTWQIYKAPRDKLANFYLAVCLTSTVLIAYYFWIEIERIFR